MRNPILRLVILAAAAAVDAHAHDTWLEVGPPLARPGDVVHVELFLGNHGNDHRDFKVAGKLGSLAGTAIDVIGPDGRRTDLVPTMIDVGAEPRQGFWAGRFVAAKEGLHCVAHLREGVRHGARGLKGGKAYVLVGEKHDAAATAAGDHATPLGHPLELVLETHPVVGCGSGRPVTVRLLLHGRPLPDHRVSFVPRGAALEPGFDPEHERTTDAEGRCSYTPREGNLILVVAHHSAPAGQGADHETTSYAATLVLAVPQRPLLPDPLGPIPP